MHLAVSRCFGCSTLPCTCPLTALFAAVKAGHFMPAPSLVTHTQFQCVESCGNGCFSCFSTCLRSRCWKFPWSGLVQSPQLATGNITPHLCMSLPEGSTSIMSSESSASTAVFPLIVHINAQRGANLRLTSLVSVFGIHN